MAHNEMQMSVPSPAHQWINTPRLNELCRAVAREARPTTFSLAGPTNGHTFQLTRLRLSKTTLYGINHSSALRVVSDPINCFEVYIPAAGELTAHCNSAETTVKLGEGVLYFPGECANNQWSANSKALILRTDPASLEPLIHDSLRLYLEQGKEGARRISLNHGLGRTLLNLLTQICTECYQRNGEIGAAHVGLEKILQSTLAYIVENVLSEKSEESSGSKVETKYLQRVVDYVINNLEKDIGLTILTEVSGVSARTLQYAFSKHFGKSPIKFVKQAKLHRVREELQRLSPADTTVTRVATKWGFCHASNFSRSYSFQFDELPNQTLQSRV